MTGNILRGHFRVPPKAACEEVAGHTRFSRNEFSIPTAHQWIDVVEMWSSSSISEGLVETRDSSADKD